ncbi:MAG: anthrone oxygenase family protein [Nocardioides sp.]
MSDYVLLTARTLAGLLAGVFFAYATSVMPALRAMDDDTFVTVMNKINVVIVNPVFLVIFLGAPLAAVAVLAWDRNPWAIAGAVLALVTLLVTAVFNIPLNNALADGGTREAFENPWMVWNIVRTLTSTACVVCLLRV